MPEGYSARDRLAAVQAGVDSARAGLVRAADHLRQAAERYPELAAVANQMEETARVTLVWDAVITRVIEGYQDEP